MSFTKIVSGALCTFATVVAANAAVTFPYLENFDGLQTGSGDFTLSTGGAWTLFDSGVGGNKLFQNSILSTGGAMSSTASINFSGFLGGSTAQDFLISTEFKLDLADTKSSITIGFGALGSTSTFGGGSSAPYYLADLVVADGGAALGRLRILEVAGSNDTFAQKVSTVALNWEDTYRLTLQGTYVGGALNMSLTLVNLTTPDPETGSAIDTISGTDPTPLTGTHFGYRNRTNDAGEVQVKFDNFTVAVPEPSTVGLLGLGVVGLLARRRRSAI